MKYLIARVLMCGALAVPGHALAEGCAPKQSPAAPAVHHATGKIKSFGPGNAFVNIAHDDIPGYMSAMTMSFEPENSAQLKGLSIGDSVGFDFVETPDARRVLKKIQKRP